MKRPNVPAMNDLEAVIKYLYETEEAMQTLDSTNFTHAWQKR
jgi:hypothetical protein